MFRIFISYSRRDGSYANKLYRALSHLHVGGFLDQVDIAAGASWDNAIREAIRDADAVVVLLSENSVQSNFVLAELGVAWNLDKPIIPVIPPGADLSSAELPPILQDLKFVDARRQTTEETARIIQDMMQNQ